jgi:hypothetical protein
MGNLFRFLYGLIGGRARQAEAIYPYLVQARDFFNLAVAQGGASSNAFTSQWGEVQRRLEEFELRDKKLRRHVDSLLECANKAFGLSPEPRYIHGLGDVPTPEDIERQKRYGEVGEIARDCQQHALDALRRTSQLRGAAF